MLGENCDQLKKFYHNYKIRFRWKQQGVEKKGETF